MESAVQVVLISRNSLFREGLRGLLDPKQFSIIAEGRDLDAVSVCFQNDPGPDLVVVDLDAPAGDGLKDLQELSEDHADVRIVVLANELCISGMARSLKAGADAYLVNELSGEAFSLSLMLVMQGEKVLPSTLVDIFARDRREFGLVAPSDGAQNLTDREKQILRCLLNGSSNKHIARALDISEGTVKVHLKSLMKKISAGNRTQAALWARNNGISVGIDQVTAA
jgi:two-component system nitrate/nitrite response regulator NarL